VGNKGAASRAARLSGQKPASGDHDTFVRRFFREFVWITWWAPADTIRSLTYARFVLNDLAGKIS